MWGFECVAKELDNMLDNMLGTFWMSWERCQKKGLGDLGTLFSSFREHFGNAVDGNSSVER